ncbi:MAG: DUF3592 domain-containing protein [Acidobacteriota bacterium]|nr:DUF3592 domain-containing protein [Acidobacteriota bacterium]
MATNNPQTLKIVSLILKVVGALPLLIGLGLLAGAWFTGNRQNTILKTWPTVDAEVARSELTSHQHQFDNDASSTTVYEAHIDFGYTVGGKQYTTPSGSGYFTSDYAEMKQKVDTYAPGTRHPIRYNPANPNDIRFDAGYTFGFFLGPLILAVVGLMLAGTGAALFFTGWAIGRAKALCPSCGQKFRHTEPSCPNCGAALSPGGAAR